MRALRRASAMGVAFAAFMALPATASASSSLSGDLLTVSSLPAGWAVTSNQNDGKSDCIGAVEGLLADSPSAEVTFQNQGYLPLAIEELHWGQAAYTAADHTLSNCRNAGTGGVGNATMHLAPMSFPRYGNQSVAFLLTGGGMAGDVLMARRGNVVMLLMEASMPTVDTQQFEGLAGKAVSLLR